ncbi:GNAT family N-acetyltransferase [Desulfosporosinus sp. FKA]|uniref:GNAT family N-acetyltransferase n=1 Tax=Desulfosporosinus sp. FKA TaxID=1969834 RepID=UPI000B4A3A52|nr:GNAT family N-acetyltransferase [Desulfosporosinus sp. FKA]
MEMEIRQAKASESNELTAISFISKRFWNYPEEYFDIWKKELTITPEYIQDNMVYVAKVEGKITGYFSIVEVEEDFFTGKVVISKGYWLEHLFILPEFIRKRIGSELISYAKVVCRKKNINRLLIFSDPNAIGFYDKIGATYIEESLSSIEGRKVLLYELIV